MSKIYNIAPTAKFLDMWGTTSDRTVYNTGDSFIGIDHRGDDLRPVTKRKSTHRVKWLFSSKYRKWVKSQRKSLVDQIEKELLTSFEKGNKHAVMRADMKLENDARQEAASCMESNVFQEITKDLNAARANTGNEKAFLRNLSVFFQKTRSNVSECDGATLGDAAGRFRQQPNGESDEYQGLQAALDDTYNNVVRIPLPPIRDLYRDGRGESEPLFRLQIDLKQFPGLAHEPRVAAKVVHRIRSKEKRPGSVAQNLNFDYDRSDPVVFSFQKPADIYATAKPNRGPQPQPQPQTQRSQTPGLPQENIQHDVRRSLTPDNFKRFNRNAQIDPLVPLPERTLRQEDIEEAMRPSGGVGDGEPVSKP